MSFYKQAKTDKWCILSETRNQWVLKKNQRSPTNFSSKTNLLLILALCSLYDFMIEKKILFLCNDPIIWSLKSQACIMKCISIKSQWSVFRPVDISFLLKPYFQVIKPHVQDFFITFNFKTDLSKINSFRSETYIKIFNEFSFFRFENFSWKYHQNSLSHWFWIRYKTETRGWSVRKYFIWLLPVLKSYGGYHVHTINIIVASGTYLFGGCQKLFWRPPYNYLAAAIIVIEIVWLQLQDTYLVVAIWKLG